MEIWQALFDVLVLLLGALVVGTLLERVRQSAVVGFILAGMFLGPHVLNIVKSSEEVTILAELGVSLLLFGIGLEFSSSRLHQLRSAGLLGVLQITSTAVVSAGLAFAFGFSWREAVGLGLILCLSSTACVLRVLTDRSELDSGPGRNSLGILLVQDAAVIPLAFGMEFLALGGEGGNGGAHPLTVLLGAAGFGIGLWGLLRFVAPWFLGTRVLTSNRELSLLLAVVAGLGAATGAHKVGVSPALGAFIAGIVLAGSPFAVQVRSDVGALKTLLLTLFFGSVGMLADPSWIAAHFLEVMGLLVGLITLKAALVAGIVRVITGRWKHGIASGLAVAQIGEFSFLLAELGAGSVVSPEVSPYLVSVILLSLLVTPYLVAVGRPLERFLIRQTRVDLDGDDGDEGGPSVLLIGYGPSGQRAAAELSRAGRSLMVIDLNSDSINRAKDLGHRGIVGDASQSELLEHTRIEDLDLVVVTLPDPNAVELVVQTIRGLRADLPLVVRARYHIHRGRFMKYSDVHVIDEEEEVGIRLGEAAAHCLGAPPMPLDPDSIESPPEEETNNDRESSPA